MTYPDLSERPDGPVECEKCGNVFHSTVADCPACEKRAKIDEAALNSCMDEVCTALRAAAETVGEDMENRHGMPAAVYCTAALLEQVSSELGFDGTSTDLLEATFEAIFRMAAEDAEERAMEIAEECGHDSY